MSTCSVTPCDRPAVARSLCSTHYERWRSTGDVGSGAIRKIEPGRVCCIEGCDRAHLARGYCNKHYGNLRSTGEPVRDPDPIEDRAMRYFRVVDMGYETPCWISTLHLSRAGYAFLRRRPDRKQVGQHRVTYEIHKGAIPAGYEVDHLCFKPACCNPDHLEAVTPAENKRRARGRPRKRRKARA